MKKAIILLYLLILPYSESFSSISLFGYPVFTWFNLLVFGLSIVFTIKDMCNGRNTLFNFLMLLSFAATIIFSIINGWAFTKSITNSLMYYLPFFIYSLVKASYIKLSELIRVMFFGLLISTAISLLIGFSVIDGLLRDYSGAKLNVYFVDGASGIYAILIGIYLLNSSVKEKRLNIMGVLCLAFGFIILIFYQSRGRTLIACGVAALMLFIIAVLSNHKKRFKLIIGVIVIVVVAIIIINNSDFLQFYLERITNRITSTSYKEDNVTYRFNEIASYWKMFCNNPLFGSGWGIMLNNDAYNKFGVLYNAHNMYLGILGITGLSFTPIFIYKLVSLTWKKVRGVVKNRTNEDVWAFSLMVTIILLGMANAGFGKNFCIAFIITVYVIQLETERKVKSALPAKL